ncbi:MAG: choice-of-anchor P family protein [Thermoleophilia bacterium]
MTATPAHPERSSNIGGLRPAGGGHLGSVQVDVSASVKGTDGTASGTIAASGLTLLDGRVAIGSLRIGGTVTATPAGPTVSLSEASASGVTVDGQAVAVGPGSRVDVSGIGTLVFLEHVEDGSGGFRANGLRLEVTDPQAASVVGSPFVLGHLDLSAAAGEAAPLPSPSPSRTSTEPTDVERAPAGSEPATTGSSTVTAPPAAPEAPVAEPLPSTPTFGLPRQAAPEVSVPKDATYVFPVFGDVSFSDDYGAPRAGTGWHHGNDLFADRGTPVVAVADGTLSKVGVNTLGGNRLWLTDEAGNQYYYAHLSAYAPASVEGARVRKGQVIAFVGNTGQAITTPPHLHFEIHPGGGDSVDPYPYLMAWQRGSTIPLAYRQAAASPSPVPAVGAVLVDGTPERDVSPAPDPSVAIPVG